MCSWFDTTCTCIVLHGLDIMAYQQPLLYSINLLLTVFCWIYPVLLQKQRSPFSEWSIFVCVGRWRWLQSWLCQSPFELPGTLLCLFHQLCQTFCVLGCPAVCKTPQLPYWVPLLAPWFRYCYNTEKRDKSQHHIHRNYDIRVKLIIVTQWERHLTVLLSLFMLRCWRNQNNYSRLPLRLKAWTKTSFCLQSAWHCWWWVAPSLLLLLWEQVEHSLLQLWWSTLNARHRQPDISAVCDSLHRERSLISAQNTMLFPQCVSVT